MQLGLPDILNKNKTLGNYATYGIRNIKIVTITLEEDNRVLPIEVSMN